MGSGVPTRIIDSLLMSDLRICASITTALRSKGVLHYKHEASVAKDGLTGNQISGTVRFHSEL